MQLIYDITKQPVKIGDLVQTFRGEIVEVLSFNKPHKPSASGRVYVKDKDGAKFESYVTVIGATWIDREDRV